MRIQGTDAEKIIKENKRKPVSRGSRRQAGLAAAERPIDAKPQPKWKTQSSALRNAMRDSQAVTKALESGK